MAATCERTNDCPTFTASGAGINKSTGILNIFSFNIYLKTYVEIGLYSLHRKRMIARFKIYEKKKIRHQFVYEKMNTGIYMYLPGEQSNEMSIKKSLWILHVIHSLHKWLPCNLNK